MRRTETRRPMMRTENIALATPDGPMPAFVARPDGSTRGAVVVLQEVFGVTGHLQEICGRLAQHGWTAIAPALYHREGSPVFGYDDLSGIELMNRLTADGLAMDLDAAFARLAAEGHAPPTIGVLGFCMGGSVALFAATRRGPAAAVTFYGVGITEGRLGLPPLIDLAPQVACPWLGCYGALDPQATDEQMNRFSAALAATPVPTDIVRYDGAGHAFNCRERPDKYDKAAADHAWNRTLFFFAEHLRTETP
jgi:carboxymethylenebutenolidase